MPTIAKTEAAATPQAFGEWIETTGTQLLHDWGYAGPIPSVEISSRLSRSLGRAYPERNLIRLNQILLQLAEPVAREILCHELAHIVAFVRHGRSARPHGEEWQQLILAAGYKPRTRMPVDVPPTARRARPRRLQIIWTHECPQCGTSRDARRPMRRWRCKVCWNAGKGGELRVTSRPAHEGRS